MKSLLSIALGIFIFSGSFAQSHKEDIDLVQAMYGKEKKTIVADFIALPADDAKKTAFWKLYDTYETQRKIFGQSRIALLEKYADTYDNPGDKDTDALMKETISLQKSVDGLIATYYDKIKMAVGVKQAGQFFQLESYFLSATRIFILDNIPFIGELEKMHAAAPGN